MKKEELIKIVEEQKHLAEAVEVKDREIISLKKLYEDEKRLNKELNGKVAASHHLSEAVIQKDKEIIELNKLNQELKSKASTFAGLETRVKQLEEENKLLVAFVNPYINTFRSTLKGIQGALELGIELEALLAEKLAKK